MVLNGSDVVVATTEYSAPGYIILLTLLLVIMQTFVMCTVTAVTEVYSHLVLWFPLPTELLQKVNIENRCNEREEIKIFKK